MSEWHIPLSDLAYGPEETSAVLAVLQRKWLSMGPEVATFEEEFAALCGGTPSMAVSNGTAALHLALLALGIGPGDEVIQPAINFVASANMTRAVGAIPIFADIVSLDEPTIDPDEIARLLTPRTKAVVVMHYGGYCCRMSEIIALCRSHGVAIIEDACHAIGARYHDAHGRAPHGAMVGQLGDVACFSFFSNKNLATGEGGMLVTSDVTVADRVRLLRSHGMTTLTWDRHKGHAASYDVVGHGMNYRFDEIRAALGRVQLRKLSLHNQRRGELTTTYRTELAALPGWQVPFQNYSGNSAYHLMVVVAPDHATRDRVREACFQARIQTSMHYPCIADFTAFADPPTPGLSISRAFAARALTLPLYPDLTETDIADICACVLRAAGNPTVAGE